MNLSKEDTKALRKIGHDILKQYRDMYRIAPYKCSPNIDSNMYLYFKDTDRSCDNNVCTLYFNYFVTAFNKLELLERKLLFEKYITIEEKENVKIFTENFLSETTFYRKMTLSIVHFIESYNNGELLFSYLSSALQENESHMKVF